MPVADISGVAHFCSAECHDVLVSGYSDHDSALPAKLPRRSSHPLELASYTAVFKDSSEMCSRLSYI